MRSPQRFAAILAILALLGILAYRYFAPERYSGLEVKNYYLLVSVDGPADWQQKHATSVIWEGKRVALPVVFRVRGDLVRSGSFSVGGVEGYPHELRIGKLITPVEIEPNAEVDLSNEPDCGFIQEPCPLWGKIPYSIVTHVSVSPKGTPPPYNPLQVGGELISRGDTVARQARELVEQGRVIDVKPEP